MVTRTLIVAALILLLPFLSGCEEAEAKREINKLYQRIVEMDELRTPDGVEDYYTANSFTEYERIIQLALTAKPAQVRALPPLVKYQVLVTRANATRAELSKLDGLGYARMAIQRGWWDSDDEETVASLRDFKFGRDSATAEIYWDGEASGIRARFAVEEGRWKYDDAYVLTSADSAIHEWARFEGMTVDEFVEYWFEEQFGREFPAKAWETVVR